MGVPRCARCGAHSYAGEATVGNKRFSLCGYCLPIIQAKLEGLVEDHVQHETPFPEKELPPHKNVFERKSGDGLAVNNMEE